MGFSPNLHQCLLAELELANPDIDSGTGVRISNGSVYRNMLYGDLSELTQTAEISLRGLEDLLGDARNRDVYLYVKTQNMRRASSDPMILNWRGLKALAHQVDRSFQSSGTGCTDQEDRCLQVDGETGACGRACGGFDGRTCPAGYLVVESEEETEADTCLCVARPDDDDYDGDVVLYSAYAPRAYEWCTYVDEPAGGGYDPRTSSMTPAQKLRAEWPTIEVFPYYDSGRTTVTAGRTQPVLVPMPSFGLHVKHEPDPSDPNDDGSFYGFLHGLTVQNPDLSIERLAEDYYRIRGVPSESSFFVDVRVSAEEEPHYAPFGHIGGSSSTLGRNLDSFVIAGISKLETDLDLRNVEFTVESLLGDGSRELVQKLGSPVKLKPLAGATRNLAAFTSTALPRLLVEVANVPFVGLTIVAKGTGATVARPSGCGWFGQAKLTTQFRIQAKNQRSLTIRGEDKWSCTPLSVYNH